MTYKIDISKENSLVTIQPTGIYSAKDITALMLIVVNDPLYKPEYNRIVDIRDVEYTPIVGEILQISQFVVSMKKHFKGKTAIIATGELLYSMFKVTAQYTSRKGLKTNIFRDKEEALAWIADPDSIKVH